MKNANWQGRKLCSGKLTKMSEDNEEHRLKIDANNEAVCRVLKAAQDDGRGSPDMELHDEMKRTWRLLLWKTLPS